MPATYRNACGRGSLQGAHADIVQLAEQRFCTPHVVGSIPTIGLLAVRYSMEGDVAAATLRI